MPDFIVAINPEKKSALPFVLCLPLADGCLWLKAKAAWPRAAKVYCHVLSPAPALSELQIVERVPCLVCERRGAAIDLILKRPVNKRSQFVFVFYSGRQLIFWQTARTAKAARPGLRIPWAANDAELTVCVDSRERYGYCFAGRAVRIERRALGVGDYAATLGDGIAAVVERKTVDDFVRSH